jgi:serine/threonine protein kinase
MRVRAARRGGLDLGGEIGGGGEATIYEVLDHEDWLAKIYKPSPRPDYDRKLAWMQSNPPDDPTRAQGHTSIAWPQDLLYNGRGQFLGYLMDHIHGAVPLLEVFNPRRRARTLPAFDWRYLHRTARNLAVALDALHSCGYVVGDLNESNVMVTPSAMVTLIDADSFQAQVQTEARLLTFYCPVGKPEYTPPELQGITLSNVKRYPEHDCFGLGVLIFQLLMDGSHPFRAQWLGPDDPPPVEEKIRRGAFPYMVDPPLAVAPPRNVLGLDGLHPGVTELMQRCFIDGHRQPRTRPTPREWEKAITVAEKALQRCANRHWFSNHQQACPRCGAELESTPIQVRLPRTAVSRLAPARSPAGQSGTLPPSVLQLWSRQMPSLPPREIFRAVPTKLNELRSGLRRTITQTTGGVVGGAIMGALVWAVGGAAFGAVGGTVAGVIGQGILWALAWAVIWASGWWAFGEVLGETIGGRGLGKGVGIGGAIGGAVIGGGLGWIIGHKGIEHVGSWAVVREIDGLMAGAAGVEGFEGLLGVALIGMVSGALVWAAVWAAVGAIGGAIAWRSIGGHTLGQGLSRVPTKAIDTAWAIAGSIEGATAGAIFGLIVGAIVGALIGITGTMIDATPIRMAIGVTVGAGIGAISGTVGAQYIGGIDDRLRRAFGIVEGLVGATVGLMIARGGLELWTVEASGITAVIQVILIGLVSGALVGAMSGALVGAIAGAILKATDPKSPPWP